MAQLEQGDEEQQLVVGEGQQFPLEAGVAKQGETREIKMGRAGKGFRGDGWFVRLYGVLLTIVHLPVRFLAVLLDGAAMVAIGTDEYLRLD